MLGTVRKFDDAKGWGFITADGGEDFFVHHTGILADGHRTLYVGQRVEFDLGANDRGPMAVSVEVLEGVELAGGVVQPTRGPATP